MDTDTLRWFQQVADGVTVTEVADQYLISQPGVSRALARLEDEVGAPLLHRAGRVLRPTHAGVVFKRHVDSLLHRLDDGLAAVNELVDPRTGSVTIAFQLSLGMGLVPRLISRFREDFPRVQFRLDEAHDDLGSSLLAEGRTDLQFTARRPRSQAVHWERLFSQPLVLAVPPGHRFEARKEISLADAAGEEFVMLKPSWDLRTLTDDLCASAGFSPRVSLEADELPVMRGLVAAGLGVAVVPAGDALVGPDRCLRITDQGASRDVGLAWSRERRLLPSAELFREHVLAAGVRAGPGTG